MHDVRVIGAPGYENDFSAEFLMSWDDWPFAVVGFDWEGEREVAVVPTACVFPYEASDSE